MVRIIFFIYFFSIITGKLFLKNVKNPFKPETQIVYVWPFIKSFFWKFLSLNSYYDDFVGMTQRVRASSRMRISCGTLELRSMLLVMSMAQASASLMAVATFCSCTLICSRCVMKTSPKTKPASPQICLLLKSLESWGGHINVQLLLHVLL